MLEENADDSLHQGIELFLKVLEITHIPGGSEYGVTTERMQSLDVLESSKGTIRGCHQLESDPRSKGSLPRLSAASMTPSLYLIPNTEVPVTRGCLIVSSLSGTDLDSLAGRTGYGILVLPDWRQ